MTLFFIVRVPPISTLFPYTTLFRSSDPRAPDPGGRLSGAGAHAARRPPASRQLDHLGASVAWPGIDRKSTRLNSSHSQISYAVFCLKKKNHRNDSQGYF